MKTSAGLLVICNGEILLVHPTNAPWHGTFSIPKGEINNGENLIEAAIRETHEETGIKYGHIYVEKTPHKIEYKDKRGKIYKTIWYFIIRPHEPPRKFKPQKEEVDWVGFVDKEEAEKRIHPKLKELLINI